MEQIEEFIAFKGEFELASLLENTDDSPYKDEVYDILKFCFDNYKVENGYILEYLNRCSPPMEETNALQEPMEEEIIETGSSLDEKEEKSDEQKEEEWIYPCLPSNESNSLSLTLFDCPPCLPKEDECYAHVICDNPLFVPNFEMHGTKEFCLENVYVIVIFFSLFMRLLKIIMRKIWLWKFSWY